MAKPTVTVEYADGHKVSAKVTPRAEVATEEKFSKGFGEMQKDGKLTVLYFMGWATLHYAGKESRDFDTFIADIADVDFDEDEVKPDGEDADDPTSLAQPTDESSASA